MAKATTPMSPAAGDARFGAIDLALLAMVFIWGINAVVVKATYAQIPPMAFMAIRFIVAAALLLLVAYLFERSLAVRRADWRMMIAVGLVGTSFYQPLFLTGLAMTTASNTALIIATSPAFVALINRALGRETLARRGWFGILLAFLGIFLIIQGGGGLELTSTMLTGDLLILAGSFLWALYAVMAAPLMTRYSPLRVTALTTTIGAIPLILIGLPAVAALNFGNVQPSGWAGLLYSAIFAIVIAFIIWNNGVKRIGGARTAFYSNLIPVVGAISAAIILGEVITPLKVAGAAIIFLGLYLARTSKLLLAPRD
ncbi:MAG: DMT family transporter [Anaerolineales bacterium]|nr:DMT family transporter [Anaerolineales bacterium]